MSTTVAVADVAALGQQWAFLLGVGIGGGIGTLLGRWEAYFQLRWARVAWHEVRRYRRLRRLKTATGAAGGASAGRAARPAPPARRVP